MIELKVSDDVLRSVLLQAAQDHVSSLDMESVTLLDVRAAAKLLDVSPVTLRKLPIETVDLGERKTKWSLKAIKDYIASKTIKVCK